MISIIVPVYNVEPYLPFCLESIAQQTYQDFEAILVDDGSTDSSGSICDNFCNKDKRFRVIHQKNRGLPEARNTGLSAAKGDYFGFVDSDDYIHPLMYELLLKACKETGCEVAMSNVMKTFKSGAIEDVSIEEPYIIHLHDIIKKFVDKKECFPFHAVWNKLYDKRLKGLRFNNVESEDTDYIIRMYFNTEKMAVVDSELYYYLKREGSITNNITYRNQHPIDIVVLFFEYLKYFPKDKKKEKATFLCRIIKKYLSVSFNNKGTCHEEYCNKKLKNFDKVLIKEIKASPSIPFFQRTYLVTFLKYPYSYSQFRRVMEKVVTTSSLFKPSRKHA